MPELRKLLKSEKRELVQKKRRRAPKGGTFAATQLKRKISRDFKRRTRKVSHV